MAVSASVSNGIGGAIGRSTSQVGMQGVSAPILVQNIVSETNDNLITEVGADEIVKE